MTCSILQYVIDWLLDSCSCFQLLSLAELLPSIMAILPHLQPFKKIQAKMYKLFYIARMVQKYSLKSDSTFQGRTLWAMVLLFTILIKFFMFVSERLTLLLIDHFCRIFTIPLLHIFIWRGECACHFSSGFSLSHILLKSKRYFAQECHSALADMFWAENTSRSGQKQAVEFWI